MAKNYVMNGKKVYPFNWEKHEHKIETEELRIRNRIDALVIGDEELLGKNVIEDFNAKPKEEQDKIFNYLERLADRIAEVREIASGNARIGKYGTLVTFVDGKTYNALQHITNMYLMRCPAHLVKYVA